MLDIEGRRSLEATHIKPPHAAAEGLAPLPGTSTMTLITTSDTPPATRASRLLFIAVLMLLVQTTAATAATTTDANEALFPMEFDPNKAYRSHSYTSLVDYIDSTYGATNAYAGHRTKVFATVNGMVIGTVNSKIRNAIPEEKENVATKTLLGPRLDLACTFCRRSWRILNPKQQVGFGVPEALWEMYRSRFGVYLAFPSDKSFDEFMQAMMSRCNSRAKGSGAGTGKGESDAKGVVIGCYVAASGVLGRERVNFRTSMWPVGPGVGERDLPFLLVDKVEIYFDPAWREKMNDAMWELTKDAARVYFETGKFLFSVYKAIPK